MRPVQANLLFRFALLTYVQRMVTIFVYCAIESGLCGCLQQAVEQDPSLTAEEKKHRRHKIEEEIAAGLGVAAVGYEVRYVQRNFTKCSKS